MKRQRRLIFLFFMFFICSSPLYSWALLQGRTGSTIRDERNQYYQGLYRTFDPFYSGPLLAPSAYVVPRGYFNVQPYFFWQKNYGFYDDNWNRVRTRSSLDFKFLSVFQVGITDYMEATSTIAANITRKEDQRHSGYGDTFAALAFQLLEGIQGTAIPGCKLQVGVIFPTGKYDGLRQSRLGIDALGAGSYGSTFSLNFQKDFNTIFRKSLDPRYFHPFRLRWSFGYSINSRARVKGLSAYGGNKDTQGSVQVGNNFISIFAWEFSFNKHWVFATDWQYEVKGPSTFHGKTGGAKVGLPASQNWSVAPAIEYNFNSSFGALVGAWMSFAGKNSDSFITGIFSFTYFF